MSIYRNTTNRVLSTIALGLSLLLVIGGLGCKKQSKPAATTSQPNSAETTPSTTPSETTPSEPTASMTTEAPESAPAEEGPDTMAATVNGEVIGDREVEAVLDRSIQRNLQRMGGQVDPAQLAQYKEAMKPRVLEDLISQRLLDQQVQAAQIEVTEEEAVSVVTEQLAKYNASMTFEKYKEMVESQGGNVQDVLGQIEKDLARQKFIESQWAGKVDVNDREAKDYYDAHPDDEAIKVPEKVQASHILIKPDVSDPNTDPNDAKAAARTEAEGLLAQIKDGADFAELAKANSDCPSSAKGGDLGPFVREQMVKPFSDAAFMMEPNEVSDIVETRFGYHIIKVTDRMPEAVKPFEEVKADVVTKLENQKKREFATGLLQSLRDRATIVYPEQEDSAAMTPVVPTPPAAETAETPATSPAPATPAADANDN